MKAISSVNRPGKLSTIVDLALKKAVAPPFKSLCRIQPSVSAPVSPFEFYLIAVMGGEVQFVHPSQLQSFADGASPVFALLCQPDSSAPGACKAVCFIARVSGFSDEHSVGDETMRSLSVHVSSRPGQFGSYADMSYCGVINAKVADIADSTADVIFRPAYDVVYTDIFKTARYISSVYPPMRDSVIYSVMETKDGPELVSSQILVDTTGAIMSTLSLTAPGTAVTDNLNLRYVQYSAVSEGGTSTSLMIQSIFGLLAIGMFPLADKPNSAQLGLCWSSLRKPQGSGSMKLEIALDAHPGSGKPIESVPTWTSELGDRKSVV